MHTPRSTAPGLGSLLALALAGCPDKSSPEPGTGGPSPGTSAAETTALTDGSADTTTTAADSPAASTTSAGDEATSSGATTIDPFCDGPCRDLPTCEDSVDLPIAVQGQSGFGPFVAARAHVGMYFCCECLRSWSDAGPRYFALLNADSGPPKPSCAVPSPDPGAPRDWLDIFVRHGEDANDSPVAHCGDPTDAWAGSTWDVELTRRTEDGTEDLPGHTLTLEAVSGAWDLLDPGAPPRFTATLAGPNFAGTFTASLCDCFTRQACACE